MRWWTSQEGVRGNREVLVQTGPGMMMEDQDFEMLAPEAGARRHICQELVPTVESR